MIEEKKILLKDLSEFFLKRGFYKTTMDEVASELHVSKKTIYKYFDSRETIINMILFGVIFTIKKRIKGIIDQDQTSIWKIIKVTQTLFEYAGKVNINTIMDIKKMGPVFWSKIEKMRGEVIAYNFSILFKQGQQEGYIKDIPLEIIINVYRASITAVINPDFLINNSFSLKQAGEITINLFMDALLTEEGKILFEKLKMEKL